jgi:YmgG-like glycine-zipper protein
VSLEICLTISLTDVKSLAPFFDYIGVMKNNLIILKNSVMKQPLLLIVIAIAAVLSVAAIVGISNNSKAKKVDAAELAQFEAWKETKTMEALASQQASYTAPKRTTSTAAKRPVIYQSPKMVSESQNSAKTTTKKKGWSKAAKGTAIGAGAGAVLGAVINKKNRVAGAVIGGVLGGGGGYVIGRSMDKKDGRVQLQY